VSDTTILEPGVVELAQVGLDLGTASTERLNAK
jgi:hypothetical protein